MPNMTKLPTKVALGIPTLKLLPWLAWPTGE